MSAMLLQKLPITTCSMCRPPQPLVCFRSNTQRQHNRMKCKSRSRAIEVQGPGGSPAPQQPAGPPEGQVSAEIVESMRAKISEALEAQSVEISDTYGDGRHVSINVVSPLFDGQSSVKRQRMVYKAIWLELQETVHAVDAMTTKTPEEAAKTAG